MANNGLDVMFQEQMGMVVLNPTNEDFDMQYAGISFTIKSGEKRTLSAAAANHILNAFTQRGLCYLAYGADEARIAEQGKQRNEDFKRKQVNEFNIRNENRKNMNMGYLPPSDKIKEYASELAIQLMQPYAPRDNERLKMNSQGNEIASMRQTIADLTNLVQSLVKPKEAEQKPEPEAEQKQRGNPNWIKK
jgi:hypothetical protein